MTEFTGYIFAFIILAVVVSIGATVLVNMEETGGTISNAQVDNILANVNSPVTLTQTPSTFSSATVKNQTWLEFDGDGDYGNLSNTELVNQINSTEVTISVWVNLNQLKNNNGNFIIRLGDSPSSNDFSFFIRHETIGSLNFSRCSFHNESSGGWFQSDYRNDYDGANFSINKWQHYICMFNTTDVSTYQDGILRNYTNFVGSRNGTPSQSLYIGATIVIDTERFYLNGSLTEFRIYNRSLSNLEILEINNSGINKNSSLPTTGLVLWLPFNENTGTTAYDVSGNSNNGTITGATWADDAVDKTLISGVDYTQTSNLFTIDNSDYAWSLITSSYAYLTNEVDRNISRDAAIGLSEYGKWFVILAILGIIVIVLKLLFSLETGGNNHGSQSF